MPSFVTVTSGATAQAQDVNQLINALNGSAGNAIPISLTALNDSVNFALALKNADPTNSRTLQVLRSNNNVLLQADANGVIVSPDGGVATAQVVNTSLAQTLTNKTLGAGTVLTATGIVATAQLAANAATQRFVTVGSTSGPTTVSTALVDLQEMVVNLTTVGGDIEAYFVTAVNNSGGSPNGVSIALKLDAAAAVGTMTTTSFAAGASIILVTFYLWTGVAAGAHTVKGQFAAANAGTATAVGTQRQMIVKEIKA